MLTLHHDGSSLYVSNQRPALGEVVRVRLRVEPEWLGAPPHWVGVRSNPDREPRFDEARCVQDGSHGEEWWEASVPVANPTHRYRWLVITADGTQHWLSQAGLTTTEPRDHDDFRLVAGADAPDWADDAALYQVFPDRFAKSSDAPFDRLRAAGELPDWAIASDWADPVQLEQPGRSQQLYGGDLDGVRERLDHLVELGITLLYLTPGFPARSNHRYDASTFDRVDDLLGGDAALVRLVEAAHARGIRVIGDLTANHSGDAHEWFRTAQGDAGSVERGFYYFRPDGSYESWLGVPSLPKFDWASTELRERFIEGPTSVVAKYLQAPFNLDGWRIDVANMTGRLGSVDLNAEVRRTIRATMTEINPDTLLLGESTNDGASDFQGDAWHGAMTYAPFTRPVWSWLQQPGARAEGGIGFARGQVPTIGGTDVVAANTRFAAGYPWATRVHTMAALDTHDTPRFATSARPGAVPVAFGLAVTLPGLPVVWAGDEFGLTGIDGEASRTPIPWGADAPMLDVYRSLIGLRRTHPALAVGGMRWLAAGPDAIAFVRETADASVLVIAARAAARLELPGVAVSGEPLVAFGDVRLEASDLGVVAVSGDAPAFAAWALPGVASPAW
ncbi:MAG TPA: glycoside hydrolase family 13 protein [Candidatus Lumbricidophila sp.]|nr:glycoside hydrolase family 13 protein [Candidatus Lumbricidophila sp.]